MTRPWTSKAGAIFFCVAPRRRAGSDQLLTCDYGDNLLRTANPMGNYMQSLVSDSGGHWIHKLRQYIRSVGWNARPRSSEMVWAAGNMSEKLGVIVQGSVVTQHNVDARLSCHKLMGPRDSSKLRDGLLHKQDLVDLQEFERTRKEYCSRGVVPTCSMAFRG